MEQPSDSPTITSVATTEADWEAFSELSTGEPAINTPLQIQVSPRSTQETRSNVWFTNKPPMVTLQVENTLYKVHRILLERESEYFRTLFPAPAHNDGQEVIHKLDDSKESEVDALFDFLYDPAERDTYSDEKLLDLLAISTRYSLLRIRGYAVKLLGKRRGAMDPIDQIVLAQKYDIADWLESAYSAIIVRANPLQEHEAERLPIATVVMLARAREESLTRNLLMEIGEGSATNMYDTDESAAYAKETAVSKGKKGKAKKGKGKK
ncbi:hypothetical protein EWM64_g9764 [Hericium alpestre]|uniref:BTB domain-containing protein n=1 Tax=Hericium alpestre TaxID=135208 RepID=A0A4Y9ZLE8_9AGAM|nr:hypothetical protein EWM64_g9764 [Hericium alpestre]